VIYASRDEAEANALRQAARRDRLRLIHPSLYTDDFETPSEQWIAENLLAVLAIHFPGWFVSHSTAASGRSQDGVAFISGHAASRKSTSLPGVVVKRLKQFPYPEIVTVDTGTVFKSALTSVEEPVLARMSSPLQTVFELLHKDARQPERSLPDQQIRALVDQLSRTDRIRAEQFADRNGLEKEYRRFREYEADLSVGKTVKRPDQHDLEVYFYHYRVGRLTELPGREFRFQYDPSWKIELSGLPLGTAGPAYEGPVLPPFFDNLLPEGWAEARLRTVYKIASDDAYALLETTPKYLSNVTLRPPGLDSAGITLDVRTATLSRLLPQREARTRVVESVGGDPDSREMWLELRRRGATGLSGVQAKLPIHLAAAGGMPLLSVGHLRNTSTHILKLPSSEYAEIIPNEWAAMELARRIGLDVADVRQVEFQQGSPLRQPALLIERFDLPDSLEGVSSLPLLEDAASLMGLSRREKYQPSLERVADCLREAGLTERDLTAFLEHVVFSWIIANGDLHTKNMAVLHEIQPGHLGVPATRRGVRYAPLYDLLNTCLLIPDDLLALPVNGKQNNLRRKDFVVLGRRCGIPKMYVDDRVAQIVAGVTDHLNSVLASSGLSQDRQDRFREIVGARIKSL